jgi:hypothetical protein
MCWQADSYTFLIGLFILLWDVARQTGYWISQDLKERIYLSVVILLIYLDRHNVHCSGSFCALQSLPVCTVLLLSNEKLAGCWKCFFGRYPHGKVAAKLLKVVILGNGTSV